MSPKRQPSRYSEPNVVLAVVLLLFGVLGVVVLTFAVGWTDLDETRNARKLATLADVVGLGVFLLGVTGLVQAAWLTPGPDRRVSGAHVALVLAGGMLVGGGWGAALGLGALASTSLLVASRRAPDDEDPAV